jgi:hypothetical protein
MISEFSASSPVVHRSLYSPAPMISVMSIVNFSKMFHVGIEPSLLQSVNPYFTNEPHLHFLKSQKMLRDIIQYI